MKHAILLPLIALSACLPSVQERKIGPLIEALEDVYQWDPGRGAYQSEAYLQLLRAGEGALPLLAEAVLDPRPTKIMDRYPKVPTVGDVAFLLALEVSGKTIEEFRDVGVARGANPNPIFALEFQRGARARARDQLLGK